MLIVLPVAAFAVLWVALLARRPELGWRRTFLRAGLLWGGYLVFVTESLSQVHMLTTAGMAAAWLLLMLGSAVWLARRGWREVPRPRLPQGWLNRSLAALALAVMLVVGVVAWLAPPQDRDALHYRVPRVAHWAQQRSVEHFATGIEQQNSRPPGAEYAMLNVYLLGKGDRWVNFVQWFAMLGSVLGVSLLAQQLGSDEKGQVLASVFAVSIPMGIAQASGVANDYVVAFWMVCVAAESLDLLRGGRDWQAGAAFAGLGAGLAALTKPTALAYLLPFGVLVAIGLARRRPLRRVLIWSSIGLALALSVNAGHLARTYATYGSVLNPDQVSVHANQRRDLPGLISNVLRNAGLQAVTPWRGVNELLTRAVFAVHAKMGIDPNDPQTTAHGEFRIVRIVTEESTSPSPLHALLALLAVLLLLGLPRRFGWAPRLYGLAVATSFVLFSFVFKWQIFGARYHLPFFVLVAPVVAFVFAELWRGTLVPLLGLALVVASWPWLVGISARPLIARPGQTAPGSILRVPRDQLYFANAPEVEDPFREIAGILEDTGCSRVGLMLSGSTMEYPLWALLGAPRQQLWMEWIVAGTPSARYADESYRPCAIICQGCPESWRRLRGLSPMREIGDYRLYMQDEVTGDG